MSVNIYTAAGLKKVAGSGFMDAELNENSNNGVKNKVIDEAIKRINTDLSYHSTETKVGKWIDGSDIYRLCIHLTTHVSANGGVWTTVATVSGLSVSKLLRATMISGTQVDNCYTIVNGENINIFPYAGVGVDDIIIEYIK